MTYYYRMAVVLVCVSLFALLTVVYVHGYRAGIASTLGN